MENKQLTYCETHVFTCEPANVGPKPFTLSCPFVPDHVEVRAYVHTWNSPGAANDDPTPVYGIATSYNLFLISASCFPYTLLIPTVPGNTSNTNLTFYNNANAGFRGNYTSLSINASSADAFQSGGAYTLFFKFTKH